jgi:8-oxo-dGTP diphosphatase
MDDDSACRMPGTVWTGHPLLTARLRLRALRPEDAPRLAELLADWEVVRHTAALPWPYDVKDAEEFIARMEQMRAGSQGVALALERTLDRVVIGVMGFGNGFGCAQGELPEIGYWLGKDHWGQGYATEALRRLVRHLIQDLGFPGARASTHPDNAASRRVLDKAGFRHVGTEQTAMPARGTSVIVPLYRLEAEDWRAAHAARPMLLVAAAALVDADGRVLMASRPPGKTMAGLWEFPGGKVNPGETPEDALVRELHEELGLDVTGSCLAPVAFASHDYDHFHLLMPLYAVRQWRGEPTAREGQQLQWVRGARLADLPMPPADIPLVALLREWI